MTDTTVQVGGGDVVADLLDGAPCGYMSTLIDGTITQVNETLLSWTGHDVADLIGRRRFSELLTGGGRIYYETHFLPALLMHGAVSEMAFDLVCADGRVLSTLVTSKIRHHSDGRCVVRTALFDATARRRYERELVAARQLAERAEGRARELATVLQQTLVPPALPDIDGLDLAAVYRPAGDGTEVGGDFYDVFQTGVDDWVVVIGDVQGKGAHAAVLSALARHTIRSEAIRTVSTSAVLHSLNDAILAFDSERLCTATVVRLRRVRGSWHATVSCAGHPRPILARPGSMQTDLGQPGSLLGWFAEPVLYETVCELRGGDVLFLYTDGVSDARWDGQWYGEERVRSILERLSPDASTIAAALLRELMAFEHDRPRDDIAAFVIGVH